MPQLKLNSRLRKGKRGRSTSSARRITFDIHVFIIIIMLLYIYDQPALGEKESQ
jgi:hypothetical protein